MTKLLVAAVTVGAIADFSLAPQPAQARHCSIVTATAQGLTQGIATNRADRRRERYVANNLSGWEPPSRPPKLLPGLGRGANPPPDLSKRGRILQLGAR